MYFLTNAIEFPQVHLANTDGLLAVGGDLSSKRLLHAYYSGIFPWFSEEQPILWFSPDPRMVLFPDELKISKSMRQVLRKDIFRITLNTSFTEVITTCASIPRYDQDGTWITPDMITAYQELFRLGYVQSIEVWQENELVGGLYGVLLKDKGVFCGESMFSKVSNASKCAFIYLVDWLKGTGVKLIDCQMYTDHLASLGAREIDRKTFMMYLK
ncbi:leucyl/phenylalanyl-tRNA--protein transferase [Aquimarina intermedia]|uniref:Leucyl/phenylalanyl-tRNA--protein transferase n=1 Tax=Aquimarina intermedia TaxID=350814 RepID=A0A5S5CFS9_9FLAO|nr:leucyl/phenylalanyl-tRNA--protein transferase [Aquimarina intermedia]TYP77146.1 leucyl/phenylalanyl-tRNA--protein transferase [Aquimarina intermedia]